VVSFGVISYGLASLGFLLLTLLLATSWEGRAQGARLIAACAATALWAAAIAYAAWRQQMPVAFVTLVEFIRDAAWLNVLGGLVARAGMSVMLSRATYLLAGGGIALAAVPMIGELVVGWSPVAPALVLVYGGLLMALAVLVLIEQVFRNANSAGRYALKYFVIGVGVVFCYDLFLYSQAQLVNGVEAASWEARGLVNALVLPLITLGARNNPHWSLNVFVSRQVVFYTTTFLAVGAYLLIMALGGYVIRLYGGTWGRIAQLVFFAGAGAVLASLVASASLRRRLRVFLSKHFYRNKYDYRVEWLRFIETLSAHDSDIGTRENAVRSVAQIVGSAGGVLYMAEEGTANLLPVAGFPANSFPVARYPPVAAEDELVGFLRRTQWVVDLVEFRRAPDLYQNLALPEFLQDQTRLRLVLPILQHDSLLGFVVLADPPPPFELTYEDRDLLRTVGRHVATHLAQHDADRRLAESRQFEAYHRLTAFVMHDLKNLAAQLSLIVANAEKHRRNPEFVDDAIRTIANSTARMQRLIEQLQGREAQSLRRRVSLAEAARQACRRCDGRRPVPVFEPAAEELLVEADPERLAMVIEHVVRNGQDATAENGSVSVSLRAEAGWVTLRIEDTGAGMSADFVRDRLFRPFDTTKGSKGMGIGAYQVREYVNSLGGRVQVQSEPGSGTRVDLHFPLAGPLPLPGRG
jgi:putative PEP-CTERM system histidine kinase